MLKTVSIQHWIVFLDGLTKKLKTTTAVHRVFDTNGIRIESVSFEAEVVTLFREQAVNKIHKNIIFNHLFIHKGAFKLKKKI